MKNKYSIRKSPFLDIRGKPSIYKEDIKDLKGDLQIVRKKYYQGQNYAKIMTDDTIDISSYIRLSKSSKDLLFYIINILEYNNPTFTIKVNTVSPILGVDRSTIYKAIKELIKAKYMAKTNTREVYWVNHNKIYKGNYTFELYAQNKK